MCPLRAETDRRMAVHNGHRLDRTKHLITPGQARVCPDKHNAMLDYSQNSIYQFQLKAHEDTIAEKMWAAIKALPEAEFDTKAEQYAQIIKIGETARALKLLQEARQSLPIDYKTN